MIRKRELARMGDRILTEVQFVGVSGQVYSVRYEVALSDKLYFARRVDAEAALKAVAADGAHRGPVS